MLYLRYTIVRLANHCSPAPPVLPVQALQAPALQAPAPQAPPAARLAARPAGSVMPQLAVEESSSSIGGFFGSHWSNHQYIVSVLISIKKNGFQSMGLPPVLIHFSIGLFMKSTSYLDKPMETPNPNDLTQKLPLESQKTNHDKPEA